MYLGTRKHSLDAKSRLTLPADFRKQVGDQVCLVPLKDALYGFAPVEYEAWVNSFFENGERHFDPRSRRDVELKRRLTAHAVMVDLDSAGRVALGKLDAAEPGARARLGLDHDVTVVGAGDHFEIWNSAKWDERNVNFADDLDALMFDDT
jgi:MraZ protein